MSRYFALFVTPPATGHSLYWGSTEIVKIYWGATEIGKIYWGATLVFESA